jgi:cyclopropane-fatty-acyl-phospholipid synthase
MAMTWYEPLLDRGAIPDVVIRAGIRSLLRGRLREEARLNRKERFIGELHAAPVAVQADAANAQHYEVPAAFFECVLGPHLKYSSGLWEPGTHTLADAERAMLALTVDRADIEDGNRILELGCGWGSLTLFMAEHFPNSSITAVSNSQSQRAFIEARAAVRGLRNVRVVTADVNVFDPGPTNLFDRVVSVEMFEHMRNYEALLARIGRWLEHDGKLFIHIFSHRQFTYAFEPAGDDDWMARHFFTGGIMPGDDLPARFQRDLRLARQWRWSGTHYEKTANAWLANLDRRRDELLPVLAAVYGPGDAIRWFHRWRIFFLACAELFGYARGEEWGVSHYLFEPHHTLHRGKVDLNCRTRDRVAVSMRASQ